MTNEEKIRGLYNLKEYLVKNPIELDGHKSLPITLIDYAIESLEQQPTDAKTYLKRREENYVEYNVEWFLKNWEIELEILSGGKIKPTDADCISREAVIKHICESKECYKDECKGRLYKRCFDLQWIYALPSVTPQPKIGKWIAQDIHNCHTDFRCSECGYIHSFTHLYGEPTADYTYCPRCGAKMESEE